MKEQKTNVMRILDQKKIPYEAKHYPHGDDAVDGVTVAQSLGQDPASVFKTLVTHGAKGGYYVFVIPVAEELDLKKAAKAVGEKSVAMLHVKELLPLTGYVRGGCSPIGMKKAVSHHLPLFCAGAGHHCGLRRQDRRSGAGGTQCTGQTGAGRLCGHHCK